MGCRQMGAGKQGWRVCQKESPEADSPAWHTQEAEGEAWQRWAKAGASKEALSKGCTRGQVGGSKGWMHSGAGRAEWSLQS